MTCPDCGCKFKEKFQHWSEDGTVACPACKKKLELPEEEEDSNEITRKR